MATDLDSLEMRVGKLLRYGVLTSGAFLLVGWVADLDFSGNPFLRFETFQPTPLGTELATVVREAVTNVLRHSDARTASIRVVVQGPVTTLSVENDGVRPAVGNDAAGGTGLAALAARAGAVGAELVAGPDGDDRFVVRVSRSAPSGRSR